MQAARILYHPVRLPPFAMSTDTPPTEHDALLAALAGVLGPLARLAVARGLTHQALDELLKQALVDAGRDAHPGLLAHRRVSRISTATGINRREVTRLTRPSAPKPVPRRSHASEVYTHWLTHDAYRVAPGQPRPLPRQGPAPSFDTLARTVTNDVHPRSLLDELIRLGLARLDTDTDTVVALGDAFVPRGDAARMMRILGSNIGDHFSAAAANVLGDGRQHFDQALFANELSDESMEALKPEIVAAWRALMDRIVPVIERLIAEDDRHTDRPRRQRLRIGLYTFNEPVGGEPAIPVTPATAAAAPRRRPRRTAVVRQETPDD